MNESRAESDRRGRAEPPVVELSSDDPAPMFLGRLAHDLRGPLSPLQTAAYLLRREDVGPQRKGELLDIIDRQTARLGSMLQEMSDWMRARKGNVGTRREPVNAPLLIELACGGLVAAGGAVVLPEELDEVEILGDTQHLVQMLTTFVDYMQSQSRGAGIRVAASRKGDGLEVVIEMLDSQAGESFVESFDTLFIAPQPVPFDEGLGLRLLIARAIVVAHAGSISAATTASGHGGMVLQLPIMAAR